MTAKCNKVHTNVSAYILAIDFDILVEDGLGDFGRLEHHLKRVLVLL